LTRLDLSPAFGGVPGHPAAIVGAVDRPASRDELGFADCTFHIGFPDCNEKTAFYLKYITFSCVCQAHTQISGRFL
jgi:hypothetical protein